MNAKELADELETRYKYAEASECMLDAATMLRQQQAEIEELKKFNKAILKKGGYPYLLLTDEEIEEVTNTIEWRESDWLWELDFAREILKKASEK